MANDTTVAVWGYLGEAHRGDSYPYFFCPLLEYRHGPLLLLHCESWNSWLGATKTKQTYTETKNRCIRFGVGVGLKGLKFKSDLKNKHIFEKLP